MSRIGIIADVHANLPALEAGLHVLADEGVDMIACAGDLVGYGPDPDRVVEMVMANCDVVVAGNHDLMAIEALDTGRCVPVAQVTMDWTRQAISDATRSVLASLPREAVLGPLVVTHGGLGDPERYVLTPAQHQEELDALAEGHPDGRMLVVGHTHRPGLVASGPEVVDIRASDELGIDRERRYVLNPGSLGQSRQRKPITSLAVLDLAAPVVTFIEINVNRDVVRRRLDAQGLPADALHLRPTIAARAKAAMRRYAAALSGRPSTPSHSPTNRSASASKQ